MPMQKGMKPSYFCVVSRGPEKVDGIVYFFSQLYRDDDVLHHSFTLAHLSLSLYNVHNDRRVANSFHFSHGLKNTLLVESSLYLGRLHKLCNMRVGSNE
jgi:hypothetical protein